MPTSASTKRLVGHLLSIDLDNLVHNTKNKQGQCSRASRAGSLPSVRPRLVSRRVNAAASMATREDYGIGRPPIPIGA